MVFVGVVFTLLKVRKMIKKISHGVNFFGRIAVLFKNGEYGVAGRMFGLGFRFVWVKGICFTHTVYKN